MIALISLFVKSMTISISEIFIEYVAGKVMFSQECVPLFSRWGEGTGIEGVCCIKGVSAWGCLSRGCLPGGGAGQTPPSLKGNIKKMKVPNRKLL